MGLPTIDIAGLKVSRVLLGGNPFSGFSHQSGRMDDEMRHYYTAARIKAQYACAEQLGVNTHVGRADHHIMRVLMEYWDEGGKIQWIAQTCPELGTTLRGVQNALRGGAAACYVHGGRMDYLLANDELEEAVEAVEVIHKAALPAGVAGHTPKVFDWAEENLDADFYMCSYYNPLDRSRDAAGTAADGEAFDDADRDLMAERIETLSKPAIHYKVFAAGRKNPAEALAYVARHLRPQDAVCVGVYSAQKQDMLAEDIRLLREALAAEGKKL